MQISLILPQIVALDVVFALAACLQTIHVPLISSRRSSYNRKVICAYEASLVLHLVISALILFASSGSYLVAPLAFAPGQWAERCGSMPQSLPTARCLWRTIVAPSCWPSCCSLQPRRRRWCASWARRGPWSLLQRVRFFLFRSIAALLMDVRNRQEDITAFSTIETINVIPVGILYLDPKGRPLLMNRLHAQKPGGASHAHRPARHERHVE